MDEANSSAKLFTERRVDWNSLSRAEDWYGIRVVTDTRVAPGVMFTASNAPDRLSDSDVTTYALVSVGGSSERQQPQRRMGSEHAEA